MCNESGGEQSPEQLHVSRWRYVVGFMALLAGILNFGLRMAYWVHIPVPFYKGLWEAEVSAFGYLFVAMIIYVLLVSFPRHV